MSLLRSREAQKPELICTKSVQTLSVIERSSLVPAASGSAGEPLIAVDMSSLRLVSVQLCSAPIGFARSGRYRCAISRRCCSR